MITEDTAMFGPGAYRPDPTEGITTIADLPPPELVPSSRTYTRQACPRCGHQAYRDKQYQRTLHDSLNLSPFVGGQSGQNTRQIHPSWLCARWPGLMRPVRSAPPARTHCADESCGGT